MANDMKVIRKALLKQGWTIEQATGKGYDHAYPPDYPAHGRVAPPSTPAGRRWRENLIARLRQQGFIWPPPK